MKKFALFAVLTLLLQGAFAQDQIVKLNGDEIPARVLEITLQEVLYQHPDSLQGKTWRIPKAEVFMVRFANGSKEVFTDNLPENQLAADTQQQLTPEDMYLLGRQDAQQYYKGNDALWGSAASSLFFPYYGAGYVGSVAIALIRPKAHNHPVSDINLLSNPDYVRGYETRAHSRKAGKAAAGAGIGTAITLTAILILLSTIRWH